MLRWHVHAAGASLALILEAFAIAGAAAGDAVDADANKVAIKGYDTVSYFTDSKAVKGDGQFQYDWNGAHWFFASAEHKKLFSQRPDAYAPRFGGFCAFGMTMGKRFPVDPEAWVIVDNKLYLNSSQDALGQFKQNIAASIAQAASNWEQAKTQQ
jgi:YHS domain-containing protein